ncbi:Hvo_1808 family surface protein [Halococcus sp. PRR34]|uniref:Hvo_1808 family surface protein n=1 Tax=Halococcus sp. PRR34 TaxID=3020830 RepID=UPI00235EFB35|nr:Hvo_1808 family surface protein [Halococcus sp. PRR34]
MRQLAALLFAVLVVLAGCSVPFTAGNESAGNDTSPEASPTSGDATTTPATDAATGTASETDGTTGNDSATESSQQAVQSIDDPAEDVLGWENGVWYNESVPVVGEDGLNATERRAVVNRTMARLERVRQLEFNRTVPVEVISREEFQQRPSSGGGDAAPAFRTFDNTKFEGLFLIGEDENSLAVQQSNRGQNVLGYYSPTQDSIVVVSSSETPRLNRSTLAHELVHALQDQQFDLTSSNPGTREAYNARNGLIEGDANYVQRQYDDRCGDEWECPDIDSESAGNGSAAGGNLHLGVYILSFFPYADGPGFVDAIYQQDGWEGVNALYDDLPASTEQVIHPEKYGEDAPTNVSISETSADEWSRVALDRPGQPDYAVLGQSGLTAMFAYTLYDDYNRSSTVSPREFLNGGIGGVNQTDPFNYGLNYTDGWDGDKMVVYQQQNRTGYVWKLAWDSPAEAREFVAGYEQLLAHWGGQPTSDTGNVWRVDEESPFADAFSIRQEGNTVTIVNAPTVEDLDAVHDGDAS